MRSTLAVGSPSSVPGRLTSSWSGWWARAPAPPPPLLWGSSSSVDWRERPLAPSKSRRWTSPGRFAFRLPSCEVVNRLPRRRCLRHVRTPKKRTRATTPTTASEMTAVSIAVSEPAAVASPFASPFASPGLAGGTLTSHVKPTPPGAAVRGGGGGDGHRVASHVPHDAWQWFITLFEVPQRSRRGLQKASPSASTHGGGGGGALHRPHVTRQPLATFCEVPHRSRFAAHQFTPSSSRQGGDGGGGGICGWPAGTFGGNDGGGGAGGGGGEGFGGGGDGDGGGGLGRGGGGLGRGGGALPGRCGGGGGSGENGGGDGGGNAVHSGQTRHACQPLEVQRLDHGCLPLPHHAGHGAGGGDGGDGGGDGATQPLQLLWPTLKPASRSSVALRAATICAVQPLHSSRWQFQSPLHQSSHGGGALGGGGNTSRGGLGGFGGEGSAGGCAGGVGGCAGGGDGERQPCQSPAVSLLTEAGVHSAHRESAQ